MKDFSKKINWFGWILLNKNISYLNIPSFFYDSSGLIRTDILQTHNIKFINDINSLKKWLIMVFNN